MKDFEEIKRLWKDQSPEPVSIEDVCKRINEQRRSYVNKILQQTVAVAVALLVIFIVWITATFTTWTSHVSMLIVIFSLIYYFKVQVSDYFSIHKTEFVFKKPDEYISYLKNYRQSRYQLNTKTYQVHVILIATALALFAIEIYFVLPITLLLVYILISTVWVLLCQFVFMKHFKREEQERLNALIERLEKLAKQFP